MKFYKNLVVPVFCASLVMGACSTPSSLQDSQVVGEGLQSSEIWTATGPFSQPESVVYDAKSEMIFVSNMAGSPVDKNGQGYISTLSLDGRVLAAKWIAGLNSPKGLKSFKGMLWVAAVDEVVGISIGDAKIVKRIPTPGAQCLNDLEISPDGTIFVSDIFANRILMIRDEKVSTYAEGSQLESPNGLLWNDGKLVVVGSDLHVNGAVSFESAAKMGHIFYLDPKTKKVTFVSSDPIGMLDAVEVDDSGNFLVSDWFRSKIYRISKDGQKQTVLSMEGNTADFSFVRRRNLILVPFTGRNIVKAFRYR